MIYVNAYFSFWILQSSKAYLIREHNLYERGNESQVKTFQIVLLLLSTDLLLARFQQLPLMI